MGTYENVRCRYMYENQLFFPQTHFIMTRRGVQLKVKTSLWVPGDILLTGNNNYLGQKLCTFGDIDDPQISMFRCNN